MADRRCCDKCDARQIPPVLGGAECWDENCECHKPNFTEVAATLVEEWHQEFFGPRIFDVALGELTRRIASAIAREPQWFCKARAGNMGHHESQDCDWPVCGCDPHADKVIESLQESVIPLTPHIDICAEDIIDQVRDYTIGRHGTDAEDWRFDLSRPDAIKLVADAMREVARDKPPLVPNPAMRKTS